MILMKIVISMIMIIIIKIMKLITMIFIRVIINML